MGGEFACPECGCEIRVKGLSPGRQVRCGWCQTWVEVPFIPRADQIKRRRFARGSGRWRRWPAWAWVAVALLSAAILAAGARRAVKSHWQRAEAEAVARLVESSREAESSGRLGEALAALEGALGQARALKPSPPDLDELRLRRDRLSRREAEARLAALDPGTGAGAPTPAGEPSLAIGHALTLLARARKDPALEGLEPRVLAVLERLRLRRVEADAGEAAEALRAGRLDRALELLQRQYATAQDLPPALRSPWQGRATDEARRLIARHGVVVEPVGGQFTLGSPSVYAGLYEPALTASLRKAGYLTRPPGAVWDDLWSTLPPYRVILEVREHQDMTYLQSQNRVSSMEAKLSLSRRGEPAWSEAFSARTQVPLLGLPAYQAARVEVGDRRNPEFERILYENARETLLRHLNAALRRLPACPKPAPGDPTSSAPTWPGPSV